MSQAAPPGDTPRRTAAPDLDALLNSLNADARSTTPSRAGNAPADPQASELTARRVQALIRAFDMLHKQVGAIASQGETISTLAEAQTRTTKAITDLQRNMRYIRAIVIQQLQQAHGSSNSGLPPLQIKLVVGHLAEQYQQAARDAAILVQWAMLFLGVTLGTGVAAIICAIYRLLLPPVILGTASVFALLVALIFGGLARSARFRAAVARRAMDESTLLRTITPPAVDQPDRSFGQ